MLAAVKHGATEMVINTDEFLPGEFTRNADFSLPSERLKRAIVTDAGAEKTHFIDATRIAQALFGQSIGANMFMVGYAYQLGAIPLSASAIEQAIALNGEAVAMNRAAFHWGRRAAVDRAAVEALAKPVAGDGERCRAAVGDLRRDGGAARDIPHRLSECGLCAALSRHGRQGQSGGSRPRTGQEGLADAVARYLFKLMAYKDEYEVARLYTDGAFEKQVKAEFDGDNLRFEFHLAPPLLAGIDKTTGLPRKMSFGAWMLPAFRVLAKLKFLRGTALDPFGRTVERQTERRLIDEYEATLGEIMSGLTPENYHLAVGIAAIPEKIRGFGHVKLRHLAAAKADEAALLEQFRAGAPPMLKAAE